MTRIGETKRHFWHFFLMAFWRLRSNFSKEIRLSLMNIVFRCSRSACWIYLFFLIFGARFQIHAQQPSFLTNGLVAYYPFNGDAKDASGNGNNGISNGALLTTNRFGDPNSAYLFNGNDSHIQIAPTRQLNSLSGQVTITAWIKNHGLGNPSYGSQDLQGIFGGASYVGGNSDGGIFLRLTDPAFGNNQRRLNFIVAEPISEITAAAIAPKNEWTMVVATFDGKVISLFQNGQLTDSKNQGGALSPAINTAGRYYTIGQVIDWNTPSIKQTFNGIIDDVRVYNRALSPNEVSDLYRYESAPMVSLIQAVKPSFANLTVGSRYQIQSSTNLEGWTNVGLPFVATTTTLVYSQYWDVTKTWRAHCCNQVN